MNERSLVADISAGIVRSCPGTASDCSSHPPVSNELCFNLLIRLVFRKFAWTERPWSRSKDCEWGTAALVAPRRRPSLQPAINAADAVRWSKIATYCRSGQFGLAQCVSRDLMKFHEISADVAMIRWNLVPTCRVGLTNCWIELKLCVRRWTFTGTRTASNADAATVDWAKSVPRCTRAPTWSSANATTSGNFYSPKIFTFTNFHFPSTALQLKWINYFLKN